ncbi:MAG: NUDIX hydrolase [Dehalococcoidia bacterium]
MEHREAVAVGLIVDDDGRLLLQLRDARPGLPAAGLWGLFGGHIEDGERPAQAFLRELHEELGWRPRHFEPYVVRDVDHDGWRGVTSHVFAAHLDVAPGALVLGEGQAMRFFAPHALPDGIVPGLVPLIAEFAASDVYPRVRRHFERTFVAGLIVDARGRFLLQHRDDRPDIINPGMWSTFGGHLEPYETPEEGFLREIEEELAWRPSRCELFEAGVCACDGREHLVYDFAAPLDVSPDALELHEGQAMGWFSPDALPDGIVPETRGEIARFVASARYAHFTAAASNLQLSTSYIATKRKPHPRR